MTVDDRQVGGDHYKQLAGDKGEQHWTMMWRLFREAWFVGCITKYVLRYRKKNGVQDLEKAKHYLEKLIELETAEAAKVSEAQDKSYSPPRCKYVDARNVQCRLIEGHPGGHVYPPAVCSLCSDPECGRTKACRPGDKA